MTGRRGDGRGRTHKRSARSRASSIDMRRPFASQGVEMTDMVENQPVAPAEIAPASGEASAQAVQNEEPAQSAEPEKPAAPSGAEGNDGDEEQKRPSRSQRLQRKVQLLTQEVDELRRTAVARPQDAAPGRH